MTLSLRIQDIDNIDSIVERKQNSIENQEIYDSNKRKFGEQCRKIYQWLLSGKTLTNKEAMNLLDIGDPRARIRDLREGGIPVLDRIKANGRSKFKVYYMEV